MSLNFLNNYAGTRLASYQPQPVMFEPEYSEEEEQLKVDVEYEFAADQWAPVELDLPAGWQVDDWDDRPIRFIDGKDVGETIAWIQSPAGYPIPVRLSEIGAVDVCIEDRTCRRTFSVVERVVSMIVDPFPWDEVESFAEALQEHGFRLLPAKPPGGQLSYDFEQMRIACKNRSNTEMEMLEAAVLARAPHIHTIVDGHLAPRTGAMQRRNMPVAGVIKSHFKTYLHPAGLQLLYRLAPGERTPLFAILNNRLPVISWYLRLAGEAGSMPNWGLIRIEVPLFWFEQQRRQAQIEHVARLSRLLYDYHTRNTHYDRAAVSLHPIVRAEELLGALFTPRNKLTQRFYRLTAL